MPLKAGKTKGVVSENIQELEASQTKAGRGRTHKQNIAIALGKAFGPRRPGNKSRAGGGKGHVKKESY